MREREKLLAAAELRNSMLENVPAQKIQAKEPIAESVADKKKKKRWGKKSKESDDEVEEINEAELYQSPRPAFCANARGTKRTQIPRDVAVPYFRFRKDRFYDWPPDPTVSRATPLLVATSNENKHEYTQSDFDSSDRHPFDDRIYSSSNKPTTVRKRTTSRQKSSEEDMDFGYGY